MNSVDPSTMPRTIGAISEGTLAYGLVDEPLPVLLTEPVLDRNDRIRIDPAPVEREQACAVEQARSRPRKIVLLPIR